MGCLSFFCGRPTDLSKPNGAYSPLPKIEKDHINDYDSDPSIPHHGLISIPSIPEHDPIPSIPERDLIPSIPYHVAAELKREDSEEKLTRKTLKHVDDKSIAVPPVVHRGNSASPSLARHLRDRRAVTRFAKEPRLPETLVAHYASGVSVNVETWETYSSSPPHLLDDDNPVIPESVSRSIPVSSSSGSLRNMEGELVYGDDGMPGSGHMNSMGDCRDGTPQLASSMSVACGDGVPGEFMSLRKASGNALSQVAVHRSRRRLAGQDTVSFRRSVRWSGT